VTDLPINQGELWDPNEVAHIVRWWLSKSAKRKRRAMAVGGFDEVIQQVYWHLLSYPPKDSYALTTIVCKTTNWMLNYMRSKMWTVKLAGKCRGIVDRDRTSDTIESCEKTRFVWQILCRFLDKRTAFVICQRLEGMPTGEVAARLRVHPQTVRDIFHNGISRLRNSPAAERLRQGVLF